MVHRELTAADINENLLLELLRMDDPLGVVSIYVDGQWPRAGAIETKNRLAELERRLASNGSPALADAVPRLLNRIAPVLQRLLDPGASGRGRALFAALSRPEVTTFSTQLRLPNRVVLDATPFVHPLLELLERGRPAGVALVRGQSADLLDWRLGDLRRITRVSQEPVPPPRQRPGPVGASGSRARLITPMREQRAQRERERRSRLLAAVAAELERLTDERGWERILISGGERLTTPVVAALPERLRRITLRDPRQLDEFEPPRLAAAVGARLGEEQNARGVHLGREARDAALRGGRGALGLPEVAAALNEARAEHVVYDPAVRYRGAVAHDGSLHGWSDGGSTAVTEPRLTERIVERALSTGARLTPVEGAASDVLREADGIAALLRW